MGTIIFLILFPLVVAVALLILKTDKPRDIIVIGGAAIIAVASVILVIQNFSSGGQYFEFHSEMVGYIMMGIEICLAILIFYLGIKYKKYLACVLAAIQTPLLVWFELTKGHEIEVASNFYVDRLSLIMVLIIGIIGTLICVYAIGYMKDFQHHHAGEKDRRPWFFFLMFLFHRPVGLLHLEDETGDAIEVRLWDDHGDLDRTVRFPMTLEDLVAVCADADDRLGPYTKATPGNPQAHATWAGMSEEERAAALLDALGKMRIFNLLNERVE